MSETDDRRLDDKNTKKKEINRSPRYLANQFSVSRQIIVQDIAILKGGKSPDLSSTNRGYKMKEDHFCTRILKVAHTDNDIERSALNLIVDSGAIIKDVSSSIIESLRKNQCGLKYSDPVEMSKNF